MKRNRSNAFPGGQDPHWYKDAVVYELHVRAFADSDGDGIGDFPGLIDKLDYLQDLGVTALWLLPFYPSPLRDDGYDIAEYLDVHKSYGRLSDVRQFVREAHRRGLRVLTELVCNHTSDQHSWFQASRRAKPGSPARDFYVWSDTTDRYADARIIFKDFERSNWAWDPVARAHYWHRFYSHQPDLNFDNPRVRRELIRTLDFWLEMGVDGLRLDAVPYLFEREGTSCENLPETHAFLRELRRHVDAEFGDRMLLAEANQWPEDAVAYFGSGDECHMAFHFPLMPRLFMAIRMEDRFPIIEILEQTPAIPDRCQWGLFLRNHDELTLEMVTDEERDYMCRVYAQDQQARINLGIRRRLAPLLGNHRRKFELMKGLLFSLPGTPFLYYGDEIGMGDNIYLGDRNGVRTPMQWSSDRNAGFSRANPQRLFLPVIIDPEYHYETLNVESQQANVHSLLWWMKRLIGLRKRYRAFGRGDLTFLHPENPKVLAFLRSYESERILVVANLSRFVQAVELDLSAHAGLMPVEMFGRVEFPPIGLNPYFITLGPHTFYWFSLELPAAQVTAPSPATVPAGSPPTLPRLEPEESWQEIVTGEDAGGRRALEAILPDYLRSCRWFGGKARRIKAARIVEAIPLPYNEEGAILVLLQVEYADGPEETYQLPLSLAQGRLVRHLRAKWPRALIAGVRAGKNGKEGVLFDCSVERDFCKTLLDSIANARRRKGTTGTWEASRTRAYRSLVPDVRTPLDPTILRAEQSNSSVVYGERFILKLLRKVELGAHPDVDVPRFLTEKQGFQHVPLVAGTLRYTRRASEAIVLGILHQHIPNQGDSWRYTLDTLGIFLERMLAASGVPPARSGLSIPALLDLADRAPDGVARESIGAYLESARLLGQRTAEMHLALAADTEDADFAPEPFNPFYQRSVYQSMRNLARQALQDLRRSLPSLTAREQDAAHLLLDLKAEIEGRLQKMKELRIASSRIRHHGDYHLGQVLYTGKDFVIIDFEGEPARTLNDRRLKRSPMRDVAGMLRSFHYASQAALLGLVGGGLVRAEDRQRAGDWVCFFCAWSSACFLRAYLDSAGGSSFVPGSRTELETLLESFVLEKALYELRYELNNRPDWVRIPLAGLLQILGREGGYLGDPSERDEPGSTPGGEADDDA